MKVKLRSVPIKHDSHNQPAPVEQDLDLPGCMMASNGQPLIVGVTTAFALPSTEGRLWYLSAVDPGWGSHEI